MDSQWIGSALLLSVFGVILGIVLRVFVATLSSDTRKIFQLYLLVVGIWASIGFGTALPIFEYFALYDTYIAQIVGTIFVACFIVLCVGLTAIFYDKRS